MPTLMYTLLTRATGRVLLAACQTNTPAAPLLPERPHAARLLNTLYMTVTIAVSVAVCEICSVKEWCDLEKKVRVRSRSFEMAPFDRWHTMFYADKTRIIGLPCGKKLTIS